MTKDEAMTAVEKLFGAIDASPAFGRTRGEVALAAFESLGMLKLDEPKNEAEEKFVEAVRSWPYGWTPRACLEDLKAKGLKIVEKQ